MSRRYAFLSCEIDSDKRVLTRGGRPVEVQAKVFDLLLYLIEHRDRVVSSSEILDALWARVVVTPGALSRAIHKARQAVGDDGDHQRVIATVHGRGLRFVASLRRVGERKPEEPANDFVNREAELSRFEQAIERARGGRGTLVLITGEPGIGKTRALQEMLDRADAAEVHLVRCPPECAPLAYWPWRQLARRLSDGRTAAELEQIIGLAAADFIQIEPALADLVKHEPLPALASEEMRARLFDGAVDALDRLASHRPVVLAIDDIHQADVPSLLFLRFLARRLRELRVVVVTTARDAELAADEERRALLAEAERHAGGENVPLAPFGAREVALLVEKRAGGLLDAEQVAHLHELSGGNPFFLGELLLWIEQRGPGILARKDQPGELALPATARAAVASHLAGLPPEVRRMLEVASVFGSEFSLSDLALASDGDPDAALRALDAAVATHVLEALPDATTRFHFVHPLLREAMYESLARSERARHHLRAAQALEASPAPDPLVLAYHWFEAAAVGGASHAIEWACRAAEICVTRLAFESAALHLEHALEALSFLRDASPARRGKLLIQLGSATVQAGNHARGLQLFRDALELGRRSNDPEESAVLGLAVVRSIGPVAHLIPEHREVIAAALESLPLDHPSRIELILSEIASSVGDAAARLAREAVVQARTAGDLPLLARALCTWHWVDWSPESWSERWEATREIEALGESAGVDALLEARFLRALDALEKGDRAHTLDALQSLAAAARDLGHAPSRWRVPLLESVLATAEGRFSDAATLSNEASSKVQRLGNRLIDPFLLSRSHSTWRGFLSGEVAPLEELTRKTAESTPARALGQLQLARLLVERGELASARERLAACPRDELLAALDHRAILEMTTVVASELKEESLCDAVRSRLLPYRGLHFLWPQLCILWGPASRYLALAAWGLRDFGAASDYFEEARAQCAALLATTFSIHTACDWARMLAERGAKGDRRAALGLLAEARNDAARVQVPGLLRKCDAVRAQR